jgi:guanylate kinase
VFVLSAPSGTGKTTLSHRLLRRVPGLRFSVSHTTRAPRPGEREGTDYHFVSERQFLDLRKRGEFLEWAEVDGALYGTSREQLERHLGRGKDVLLDIDTQGAVQVRRKKKDAVLIFLLPPGPAELRRRHRRRGTNAKVMARRLLLARREVTRCGEYDYLIVNDRLEEAIRNINAIIRSERCRTRRQRHRASAILKAFRTAPPTPRIRN